MRRDGERLFVWLCLGKGLRGFCCVVVREICGDGELMDGVGGDGDDGEG